jgi:hypothetical protein
MLSRLAAPRIVGPTEGKAGSLGSIGVRFIVPGEDTEGGFALVEHPMPPRHLAAPFHRHNREDEYSFVLEAGWVRCSGTTSSRPVRRPRLQAARTVAHVLECRRRGVPNPRDHRSGGVREILRRARGCGRGNGCRTVKMEELSVKYAIDFQLESIPELWGASA